MTFHCIKNDCSGITIRQCISRQLASGKVHSNTAGYAYYEIYPECPGTGEDICQQGVTVMAENPSEVEWAKARKPRGTIKLFGKRYNDYLEMRCWTA